MRRDLDDVIQGWPYNPEPGEHPAREVRARDGRMVLQIRIELGVLQLEVAGRPDGSRPHGFITYLDYLRHNAAGRGLAPGGKSPPWMMTAHQCAEADREFIQFYHRRIAWLALRRHEKAICDADHTIALMESAYPVSAKASAAVAVKSIAGSTVCHERTSSTMRLPWPVNAP